MLLAPADAAPADRIEVSAVDRPTEDAAALRHIVVDVVQHAAGIETRLLTQGDTAGEPAGDGEARPPQRPDEAARRESGQWLGQRIGLVLAESRAIGVEQVGKLRRPAKPAQQEFAHEIDGLGAIAFAQGVVEEAVEDVALFHRGAEPVEEVMLRPLMHDMVGAGDQELSRHRDGLGVGHDAFGGLVEAEQHIDGDRPCDQRIRFEAGDPLPVVGEEAALHIGIDEEVAAQPAHEGEALPGEGNVKLHLEGRRCQDQRADRRRIVMNPGGGEHGPDALRHDGNLVDGDLVFAADMVDEALNVAHRMGDAGTVAACARRAAVAPRVEGEEGETGQRQLAD